MRAAKQDSTLLVCISSGAVFFAVLNHCFLYNAQCGLWKNRADLRKADWS
jgi:hypothetical protein